MNRNFGMTGGRVMIDKAGGFVWIIAMDGGISVRRCLQAIIRDVGCNVGDDGKSGRSPPALTREFQRRILRLPRSRPKMMEIARRMRHGGLVILELLLTVVVEQPVEELLIIWPMCPSALI